MVLKHPTKNVGMPLSILDLVMVNAVDGSPGQSMQNSLDLARHAEQWGYKRYWLAEHHNTKGIASTATYVLVGFMASGTSTIRVHYCPIMLMIHGQAGNTVSTTAATTEHAVANSFCK
jgi:hypothetical protein